MPSGIMKFTNTIVLIILVLISVSCGGNQGSRDADGDQPIRILVTTGMIGDIVKNLVRDRGEVTALMGPGSDPHLYTPRRADLARLSQADLIFYNGLELEGKMVEALKSQRSRVPVVAVAEELGDGYELIHGGGAYDPHVWMDVQGWIAATGPIREALVAMDPEGAEFYTQNAAEYIYTLTRLDNYIRNIINNLEQERRVLVTAHDAFSYFGRAYEVEVHGIQGISTESEAGLRDINRLVDMVVEQKIPAVFVESTVSDRMVMTLVEGAGARGYRLKLGGELYSDSLGPSGSNADTYVGMVLHNVQTFVSAMGGEYPPFQAVQTGSTP
ncbi:MAG: zinc ABC transporter substrate-binding protein [Candidatus Sumerlaeia bacterium]|nr:zinc ABC transporter substrate-binding protein [Candidatus Sumerlaeia bacterium]